MIATLKRLFCKLRPHRVITAPQWPFTVMVDGQDLVVYNATCTAFGGTQDRMDNGETASGVSTALQPEYVGCALPMSFGPCKGSPLPRLPWFTPVHITEVATGKTITASLIDLGPARRTGNAIDLTVAASQYFVGTATANNFKTVVNYRIKGGAAHLV